MPSLQLQHISSALGITRLGLQMGFFQPPMGYSETPEVVQQRQVWFLRQSYTYYVFEFLLLFLNTHKILKCILFSRNIFDVNQVIWVQLWKKVTSSMKHFHKQGINFFPFKSIISVIKKKFLTRFALFHYVNVIIKFLKNHWGWEEFLHSLHQTCINPIVCATICLYNFLAWNIFIDLISRVLFPRQRLCRFFNEKLVNENWCS